MTEKNQLSFGINLVSIVRNCLTFLVGFLFYSSTLVKVTSAVLTSPSRL